MFFGIFRDILLLEAGFLAVILAPLSWVPFQRSVWFGQHDSISLWLVKWLLFRLMFASGVVKLTSGCPTWWGLTGKYQVLCSWYQLSLVASSSLLCFCLAVVYK